MSQEQLSEMVDVDPRYISRIELGKCFPSLETLENIARALQAEMRDLFDYDHNKEELNVQKVLEGIVNGVEDDQQRKMILRITRAVTRAVVNEI